MKSYNRHPHLAERKDSVLVIIDVQEKLYPHVIDKERLISNIKKLVKVTKLLGIPVIVTEQEKLGETLEQLREVLKESYVPIRKTTFSCIEEDKFRKRLEKLKKSTFILTGIESHVCIEQTALDMLKSGYRVHVVEDAVSSRNKTDLKAAIKKMSSSGVTITSTETVMYEWMERADDEKFKEFLEIAKYS